MVSRALHWSDAGFNASPATRPTIAASSGAASDARRSDLVGGDTSAGMGRNERDEKTSTFERNDDGEDHDRNVEEREDPHPDRVEARQRRCQDSDERRRERNGRHRAEEDEPVDRVPADLTVARDGEDQEAEEREVREDEERRTRRGGA